VAWLVPELDDGAEPELKPEFELELELDEPEPDVPELDEPELEEVGPELVEPEPLLVEPVLVEPEPVLVEPEPEEPELLLEEVPELAGVPADESDEEVLCTAPGRVSATTPAAATLAMVTVVVTERTLDRPRVRSAIARRTRSRYSSLINSIVRSRNPNPLQETSRLAMRPAPVLPPRRRG
jgi:hypothetical protein